MKCEKCKRTATTMNKEYHDGIWLCTYHANKAKKSGRINKKLNKNELDKQITIFTT